jgi:hypothetical protein
MALEKNDHIYWVTHVVSTLFILGMGAAIFFALKKHVATCWAIPCAIALSIFPAAMFFREELESLRDWWTKKFPPKGNSKE